LVKLQGNHKALPLRVYQEAHLTLIHQMKETKLPIEKTRSDKPPAVLISKREKDDLTQANLSPWEALMAFREQAELEELNIDPEMFNVRKVQAYQPK